MRRRELIALLGSAAVWPVVSRAQQSRLPTIGFLSSSVLERSDRSVAAFYRGLGEVGYVEGRTVSIEYRSAEDQLDRLPALAADLVRRQVDVIATAGNVPAALAAKAATPSIPIVFLMGGDPVENGLVASVSRPGGNVTGATTIAGDLFEKRLALLHELIPSAKVIASLVNPANSAFPKGAWRVPVAARALGVEILDDRREGAFLAIYRGSVGPEPPLASDARRAGGVTARLNKKPRTMQGPLSRDNGSIWPLERFGLVDVRLECTDI
jgi:putative tryptophan/tyrosine transport system substrate-binding protein